MWSVDVDAHLEQQDKFNEEAEASIRCLMRKKNWMSGVFYCVGGLASSGIVLTVLKLAGVFAG